MNKLAGLGEGGEGGAALACSAFCLSLGAEGGGVELLLFCGADALLAGAIGFGLRRFPPEKPGAGTLLPAMACILVLLVALRRPIESIEAKHGETEVPK